MSARTALTIGNFDGVHQGHAALVQAARNQIGPGGRVVVLCFDPNPRTVLRPDQVPVRLSHFEQRERLLKLCGADVVERVRPTSAFLGQSPETFVQWLLEEWEPSVIVEGPDFRFGQSRSGNMDTLRSLGLAKGFEVLEVPPVEVGLTDHTLVHASSTMARWLIRHGRVRDAHAVLGHPYTLCGTVVKGDQRGRTMGFPTANLDVGDQLLPDDGIYAGVAVRNDDGARYAAAISIGTKPTFGQNPRTCEAFLLAYDGPVDDYGWTMRLSMHDWLRGQITYRGVEPLLEQLRRDVEDTRRSMASLLEIPACSNT